MSIPEDIKNIKTAIQEIPEWNLDTEMLSTPHLWNAQKSQIQIALDKIADCLGDIDEKLDTEIYNREHDLPIGSVMIFYDGSTPYDHGLIGAWTQLKGFIFAKDGVATEHTGSLNIARSALPNVRLTMDDHTHAAPTQNADTQMKNNGTGNGNDAFDLCAPSLSTAKPLGTRMPWIAKTVNYKSPVFSNGQYAIVCTSGAKPITGSFQGSLTCKFTADTSPADYQQIKTESINGGVSQTRLDLPRVECSVWVRTGL
jgi:hypothetical protein